jgi:hypothetical protein
MATVKGFFKAGGIIIQQEITENPDHFLSACVTASKKIA